MFHQVRNGEYDLDSFLIVRVQYVIYHYHFELQLQ